MKFFLDTADLADIRWAARAGLIDGVTTNPTLMSRDAGDVDPNDVLKEICSLVDGPVSAEVVAVDAAGMYDEGRELAKLAENIVVKVPLIEDGLVAARRLAANGIKVNVTLAFSSVQCLVAAKAGATYVSPFLGRLDDIAHVGMDLVRTIRTIYNNYGLKTQILAASLRNPLHVVDAALAGADVSTLPFAVFQQLLKHPLTDIGLKRFLEDWEKAGVKL